MNTNFRSSCLTALTAALVALPACDAEPPPVGDDFEVEFRGDHRTVGTKFNTNFLGFDEELPLDALPMDVGAEPGVDITEIRAFECMDVAGGPIFGDFSTNGLAWDLEIDEAGNLQPITVAEVGNPANTCTIFGDLWENTHWEIQASIDGQTVVTDLWLRDLDVDMWGSTVYEWLVNYERIDPNFPSHYMPTCDEDLHAPLEPGLSFHAYLVPGLSVNETNGDFSTDLAFSTAFIACRSGAVGKAASWGYTPWDIGSDPHELATRMVRADYCGDGVSNTESGTEIWVHSDYGPDPVGADPLAYEPEAAWSENKGRALCVDLARLPANQGQSGWDCGAFTLPVCKKSHFNSPQTSLYTHTSWAG